jgi:hypothetical protein
MRSGIIVAVATLLCPSLSIAQQSARFGASDKAVIEQLFDRYNQAVSTKDYPQLREQLQAPFLRFPAGVEVLPTLDDVMNFYRMLRDSFDLQYARSQLVESRITGLAADQALVNGRYRRYRKDGPVLLEAAAIYLVSKSSGAWKICGVFAQDLDAFGKVY